MPDPDKRTRSRASSGGNLRHRARSGVSPASGSDTALGRQGTDCHAEGQGRSPFLQRGRNCRPAVHARSDSLRPNRAGQTYPSRAAARVKERAPSPCAPRFVLGESPLRSGSVTDRLYWSTPVRPSRERHVVVSPDMETETGSDGRDPRRSTVSVAGVSSAVLNSGSEASSEAVVFVHGNPGAAHEWSDLLRRAGSFARCVAIDMPGFAGADKPRDFDYSAQGYARHLHGAFESSGSAALTWSSMTLADRGHFSGRSSIPRHLRARR
jgi:hypothetical protein